MILRCSSDPQVLYTRVYCTGIMWSSSYYLSEGLDSPDHKKLVSAQPSSTLLPSFSYLQPSTDVLEGNDVVVGGLQIGPLNVQRNDEIGWLL